jgi:hypothetical protein
MVAPSGCRCESSLTDSTRTGTKKREIDVPLKRILDRKSPDVKLAPNDILYVLTNGKLKAGVSLIGLVSASRQMLS